MKNTNLSALRDAKKARMEAVRVALEAINPGDLQKYFDQNGMVWRTAEDDALEMRRAWNSGYEQAKIDHKDRFRTKRAVENKINKGAVK